MCIRDSFRDWQAVGDAPDCIICSVPGVRNPQNVPQTQGVESIEAMRGQSSGGRQYYVELERLQPTICAQYHVKLKYYVVIILCR